MNPLAHHIRRLEVVGMVRVSLSGGRSTKEVQLEVIADVLMFSSNIDVIRRM